MKRHFVHVNTASFIFSNQQRYRILRHVIFWILWFLFILLTVHLPATRFPNWQIDYDKVFVEKKGGMVKFLLTMVWRQSWILLCHIAFTYVIIYYIQPRYFNHKKKWISTTIIFISLFMVFLLLHYFVQHLISLHNSSQNTRAGLPQLNLTTGNKIKMILFQVTFNLATVVSIAAAIKLMKSWWVKQQEAAQMIKEKANAELQLLKAQVHPHFLFNSLNNIYSFSLEGSLKAPEMIKKLSGLLLYMLHGCKQALVPLKKELQMINDYIALEKIRYGDRIRIELQIPQHLSNEMIAPLLLIPFVENSFKHGASKMMTHPYILLNISLKEQVLFFTLKNSKPSEVEELRANSNGGLGLKNVKKRLSLLYPGKHELRIINEDSSFNIELTISLTELLSEKKEISVYEMA